ncbi:Protein of unknown function DUF1501 [Burkholderiaceae bacterium]
MKELSKATRREFMKKAGALSVMQAATPLAASLSLMNNAAAQTTSVSGYKALVCVFMYGGNDHYGTVVPYRQDLYDTYSSIRGHGNISGDYQGIALLREKLRTLTTTVRSSSPDYALHPAMDSMQGLFNKGRAGIVMNVGPLIQPTTFSDFQNRSKTHWPLPPNLLSHNNQQAYWQTSLKGEEAPTGWGGRMADLFLSSNKHANLTCVSVTGDALFLSGHQTLSTKMSTAGVATINPLNHSLKTYGNDVAALDMIKTLSNSPDNHMMTAQYAKVMSRSLSTYNTVVGHLGTAELTNADLAYMPSAHGTESTPLAEQLEMVARMIQKGIAMDLKRQVFMVGVGGFDLHDNLVSQHPKLLKMVSDACAEFDAAMVRLEGAKKIPMNSVTTFTASDFGRTLTSNGDGSDHGWGSHHFVLGGAVKGGQFYGTAPLVAADHSQSIGHGILIPTTSLEQLFVPVARWFGVAEGDDMATVFPNAKNFDTSLSGLFKP